MNQPYDQFELKVWAQIFFKDGSVSKGVRIPASVFHLEILPEHEYVKATCAAYKLRTEIAEKLLKENNRTEGYLLLWGADNIEGSFISIKSLEAVKNIILGTEMMIQLHNE